VAFAEAWRLINALSGRKSRPAGTVARTAAERKSSLRGHFEGLLGGRMLKRTNQLHDVRQAAAARFVL